jgi:hypothetical protein
MAGRGPAPKPKEQRRRRNVPERGEWTYLPPLAKPVLGLAKKDWSERVKRLWKAWRADPVTQQYGPGDLAAIWDLADQFEGLTFPEQRLRMEALGLTPKGRQDRRWLTLGSGVAEEADPVVAPTSEVRRLRVVAPEAS